MKRMVAAVLIFMAAGAALAAAQNIIPADRRTDWMPGVTAGVPGGIPSRATIGATVDCATFALAYAEPSIAHLNYFWFGYDQTNKRLLRAKECLDRAFALQGELPEAYLALGYYYYFGHRDFDRALKAFATAQEKLPNNSRIPYVPPCR